MTMRAYACSIRSIANRHFRAASFELKRTGDTGIYYAPTACSKPVMPKRSDQSIYSQDELDAVDLSLNTRPHETLGWKSPLAINTEHLA